MADAIAFNFEQAGDPVQESYRLDRLYRQACNHLQKRLQKTARQYQREVEARMGRELRRIEEYYGGLIQERVEPIRKLFRRMAVASVRADLARSWKTENRYREEFVELKKESDLLEAQYEKELAALQREKERVLEVREKYHARVEVALTHAAFVMVPRSSGGYTSPVGSAVRRYSSTMCCGAASWTGSARAAPIRWTTRYTSAVRLVALLRLPPECPDCGRSFCRVCAHGVCHICDGPVCPDCTTSCPVAANGATLEICDKCRREHCSECLAIARFHVEDVAGASLVAAAAALGRHRG